MDETKSNANMSLFEHDADIVDLVEVPKDIEELDQFLENAKQQISSEPTQPPASTGFFSDLLRRFGFGATAESPKVVSEESVTNSQNEQNVRLSSSHSSHLIRS